MNPPSIRWHVSPGSFLEGSIRAPGSKSQSLRALLFASVASSPSTIRGLLDSSDSLAMQKVCLRMGAELSFLEENALCKSLRVMPISSFQEQEVQLFDAGNSGIVWRFCAGLASLRNGITLMTGDRSVLFRRPMEAVIDALKQVGVSIWRTHPSGGPLLIKGPWCYPESGRIYMDGFDSQPVSAMLMASALLEDTRAIEIHVANPKEVPWARLTVKWLRDFGVKIESYDPYHPQEGTFYRVHPARWSGRDYEVPSDFSSAAFLMAGALVTGSKIELDGLMKEDPQPDRVLIDWLMQAGAKIFWQSSKLIVDGTSGFQGMDIDLSGPIDLLPIAVVLACHASTVTRLKGIAGAKIKESDRVAAIVQELTKMGAAIEEKDDTLVIKPVKLHGAHLDSHRDHRLAMALAVASLGASSASVIDQVEWVDKTYPNLAQECLRLGAKLRVES